MDGPTCARQCRRCCLVLTSLSQPAIPLRVALTGPPACPALTTGRFVLISLALRAAHSMLHVLSVDVGSASLGYVIYTPRRRTVVAWGVKTITLRSSSYMRSVTGRIEAKMEGLYRAKGKRVVLAPRTSAIACSSLHTRQIPRMDSSSSSQSSIRRPEHIYAVMHSSDPAIQLPASLLQ
ncbi:hypothetical protein ABBQ38_006366 [Trebouxia sp. C0009 RCD-2024]